MNTVLILLQMVLVMIGTIKDNLISNLAARKWIALIIILAVAVVAWIQLAVQAQADFKNQYDGILTSSTISTSTAPTFVFGSTTLAWGGASNTPQFVLQNGDYIEISMIDGKVNLTTQIRDKNGDEIGDIVNNHWRIYSPQFILDRNFNDNALEIKYLKGDITFQVRLNGEKVYLAGYFYGKTGNGQTQFFGPWVEDSMFLYPSIEYPHELNLSSTAPGGGATFSFSPQ
jgi:hypothetical protein